LFSGLVASRERRRPECAVLKDERPEVRKYAAEALGNIGPTARDAFPALEDAEGDPDADVRIATRAAMKKIQK
jgi:HEAT repeat protein